MNATESFCAVLRGEIPTRVPLLVYAMEPTRVRYTVPTILLEAPKDVHVDTMGNIDPNVQTVLQKASELATFVVGVGHPDEVLFTGAKLQIASQRLPYGEPHYYEWRNVLQTPKGELTCSNLLSDQHLPAYNKEPLLKTPDDIKKLLSIPFEPFDIDRDWAGQQKSQFDERCLILWNVGSSPADLIYQYAGPERFSIWTLEHRSLLLRATEELAERRLKLVEALAQAGAGPVFHTGGFEDFIPPLQSPANLREFVLPFEKRFCEKVHQHEGFVWAHSHGRVNAFLEDFAEMGADCLQPLEPPPMGDVDLADAKRRLGDRVTLVGNIQTHDLMTAPTDQVVELVRNCVRRGKPNGRFALSPSAEPIVTPQITDRHRDNLLAYLQVGYDEGRY